MSNQPTLTGTEALNLLKAGNQRFVTEKLSHGHQNIARREALQAGQNPFAIILSCADSRVPPEIVFDQGLGDLFVIRVAGNVINDMVLASIEYAAAHLHTPLMVVLGHARCGAVQAAHQAFTEKLTLDGHLPSLVDAIAPVLETLPADLDDPIEAAVRANADYVANQISSAEPVLANLVKQGKLLVVSAYYDLDTGEVSFIDGK